MIISGREQHPNFEIISSKYIGLFYQNLAIKTSEENELTIDLALKLGMGLTN